MNPHLFVYGSLMSTAGHPMGVRLARQARLVGQGSIAGRLYRISWYPGLVESAEKDTRVQGEVYALNDPAQVLKWLDAYEGMVPGDQAQNEYKRVERPVLLVSGGEISAWVYIYQGSVAGLEPIPDGQWVSAAS